MKELTDGEFSVTKVSDMKLQDIGFYTLSDERCEQLSPASPMMRCEMLLTARCNFKCGYCRTRDEPDKELNEAFSVIDRWKTRNIRFSGGEPMAYRGLKDVVTRAVEQGAERVAVSTNGSFPLRRYLELIDLGVNDFSISLDACCASEGDRMAGDKEGSWDKVVANIRELSRLVYVTVGVVLTEDTIDNAQDIVEFAHSLGVADIRVITAAQSDGLIPGIRKISQDIIDAHPILKYRVDNILKGRNVRGLQPHDSKRCYLPIDDSAVAGDKHYPCVIYMREQGNPIGTTGPNMRAERVAWSEQHDSHADPICAANCLDVCIDHNNKCHKEAINAQKTRQ